MSAIQTVLRAAESRGQVKHYKNYYATRSPNRPDRRPSVLFGPTPAGGVWVKDMAGKDTPGAVIAGWNLNPETLKPETNEHIKPPRQLARKCQGPRLNFNRPDAIYFYNHADGSPSYQVRRVNFSRADGSPDKEFRQYHWQDGRYQAGRGQTPELLYNLPEVVKAQRILIAEGEKDADNLAGLGFVATTHAAGTGSVDKALASYKQWLRDKDIIILPDHDQPGQDMAGKLTAALGPIVHSVATVDPAAWGDIKNDVSDLITRLRKELLSNEEIKAEVERILSQAQPWPAKGPGPKELKRLAAREQYLAEARARKQELQRRQQARYKLDSIPFAIADNEEYQREVCRVRETFSSAAAWREFVELNFDELDADHEYQVKLQENKEAKMAFCGSPYKRLTATGEIKAGRILCGLCDSCKKLDRQNLRRALESAILNDPEQCLMIVTVSDKADRARINRRLRDNDLADKVLPVGGAGVAYDILMPSAAASRLSEYEPRELLIAHLNEARLDRWLETPPGERQSGKLIPSRRELREISPPDRWEREPGPDTFELSLPGVVCEGFLPEVAIEHEVYDTFSLQSALNEIADKQRKILFKRGHVILGVITSKKHYALNDIGAICQEFNRLNGERKEAQRRRKKE